ncbi:MAG: 7TM diverse intracellular signaling domain-containing protein [Burkholderiaceae bacterium]
MTQTLRHRPFTRISRVLRFWQHCLLLALLVTGIRPALADAAPPEQTDITLGSRYWVDPDGSASVDEVAQRPASDVQTLDQFRNFDLAGKALWLQPDLPVLPEGQRWYLALSASAFMNTATLYQRLPDGSWRVQVAGDHLPVARWSLPDQTPVFALLPDTDAPVWLRLENAPSPTSPRLQLLSESQLQAKRYWTFLMVGAYLGFGLLVLFLGGVHWRLYRDRAFIAYCTYVTCMLGFQVSFTGLGGLFVWNESPAWNDMAPALFVLWLSASGIWFVREVCALSRYSVRVDRAVLLWCLAGLLFPLLYFALYNGLAFALLNLYGLVSVLLSATLCLWAWRQGQAYAGWLFLGFLPVHLGYPFPALRSAGVLPDSWATQYAVMIGSAIEIPLLLYILHLRAKDFSEHRARLRALESTDPLTGLALLPVLTLRLRDALRRARGHRQHQLGLLLVELGNHADIRAEFGREAADKAMVVAAARLSEVVRDLDTVSRLDDTRFAILVEGPQQTEDIRHLAQHIVAKGLEIVPVIGPQVSLKLRLVTAMPPDGVIDMANDSPIDENRLLARLSRALDRSADDPRKVVQHLPLPSRSDRASEGLSAPPALE